MIDDITIRRGVSDDAAVIADYNARMAKETENLVLQPERLLRGVRAVLADASKGFYVVAEVDGEVVGQMMITFEWSDWRNGTFWWIQSVYVRPDFRGRGVYRGLHQFVADAAQEAANVCGLRLYVERENAAAHRTYERLGMTQAPYDVYEVDFVVQREPPPGERSGGETASE